MDSIVNFENIHIGHLKKIMTLLAETGLPITLNVENLIIQKKMNIADLKEELKGGLNK